MKLIFNEVESIASTLPIGLYAKRRIVTALSKDEDTSYYNPVTDNIVVSYPQVAQGFKNVEIASPEEKETAIRSMLYHEVSHAILTCGDMTVTPRFNIFEDERIETVLADYYHDVDFAKQVYAINGIKSNADLTYPKDAQDAFYQLVRFHNGDADLLSEVERIIKKYAKLNRSWCREWWDYEDDINKLYNEVERRFNANPNGGNSEDNSSAQSNSGSGSANGSYASDIKPSDKNGNGTGGKGSSGNGSGEDENSNNGNGNGNSMKKPFDVSEAFGDGKGETAAELAEKMRNSLDKVFSDKTAPLYDDDMYKRLEMVISNFNKKNNSGSSLQGYSGVFNPRLASRDDYRYFDRKASVNGVNKFGSFHLNLFLDNSGSFSGNRDIVNAMLGALLRLEKINRNFSFNVVHCGVGEELITDKNKYGLDCNDGTSLDYEAEEIYRKLQKGNTYNYNIVLYDGSCYNPCYKDAFKAFNHANCTIISDPENKSEIEKYAPSAKRIITNNYTAELFDNVLATITRAFR